MCGELHSMLERDLVTQMKVTDAALCKSQIDTASILDTFCEQYSVESSIPYGVPFNPRLSSSNSLFLFSGGRGGHQ